MGNKVLELNAEKSSAGITIPDVLTCWDASTVLPSGIARDGIVKLNMLDPVDGWLKPVAGICDMLSVGMPLMNEFIKEESSLNDGIAMPVGFDCALAIMTATHSTTTTIDDWIK
jgi:hypothetical protein